MENVTPTASPLRPIARCTARSVSRRGSYRNAWRLCREHRAARQAGDSRHEQWRDRRESRSAHPAPAPAGSGDVRRGGGSAVPIPGCGQCAVPPGRPAPRSRPPQHREESGGDDHGRHHRHAVTRPGNPPCLLESLFGAVRVEIGDEKMHCAITPGWQRRLPVGLPSRSVQSNNPLGRASSAWHRAGIPPAASMCAGGADLPL
jgi:hypothetical protein